MSSESQPPTGTARPVPSSDVGGTGGRYLLAIYWIAEANPGRVSTGELQRSLDVSGPSVTEMVGKLDRRGHVDYETYHGVSLTLQGRACARRLAWEFCVVTNFFDSVLEAELDDRTSYEISSTLPSAGIVRLWALTDAPCIEECPAATGEYTGCSV